MDPTSAVARTEHLVLWSRLGSRFRVADLERMLWDEHSLFEYWAHIVPVDDYDIHRESMRRFRRQVPGESGRRVYWREWMAANATFRRYILRELRRRGPLRTRDLEDRAVEGWQTGAIHFFASLKLGQLFRTDGIHHFIGNPQRIDDLTIEHAHATGGDCAHGQFRMAGQAELANNKHIKRRI